MNRCSTMHRTKFAKSINCIRLTKIIQLSEFVQIIRGATKEFVVALIDYN